MKSPKNRILLSHIGNINSGSAGIDPAGLGAADRLLAMHARLAAIAFLLFTASAVLCGQDASQTRPSSASQQETKAQSGRILKIFPSYGVVEPTARPVRPLTAHGKLVLSFHGAVDPSNLLVAATNAGIEQAFNIFPGYGQGAEGYGKRFGASLADQASNSLLNNFVFPVLLREDPRYFRKEQGTFSQRFGYATTRVLITRKDSGASTFNLSRMFGTLTASSLANAYYPDSDRGAGSTFTRFGIALGTAAAFNVISEFGPDLTRKLLSKRSRKAH